MTDNLVFNSAAQRASGDPMKFTLDDRVYEFTPPAKSTAIFLTADKPLHERVRAQLNWLSAGLTDEDAEYITGRLMDYDDPLTPGTLIDVVAGLLEEMSGRPTGPLPESSEQR